MNENPGASRASSAGRILPARGARRRRDLAMARRPRQAASAPSRARARAGDRSHGAAARPLTTGTPATTTRATRPFTTASVRNRQVVTTSCATTTTTTTDPDAAQGNMATSSRVWTASRPPRQGIMPPRHGRDASAGRRPRRTTRGFLFAVLPGDGRSTGRPCRARRAPDGSDASSWWGCGVKDFAHAGASPTVRSRASSRQRFGPARPALAAACAGDSIGGRRPRWH